MPRVQVFRFAAKEFCCCRVPFQLYPAGLILYSQDSIPPAADLLCDCINVFVFRRVLAPEFSDYRRWVQRGDGPLACLVVFCLGSVLGGGPFFWIGNFSIVPMFFVV